MTMQLPYRIHSREILVRKPIVRNRRVLINAYIRIQSALKTGFRRTPTKCLAMSSGRQQISLSVSAVYKSMVDHSAWNYLRPNTVTSIHLLGIASLAARGKYSFVMPHGTGNTWKGWADFISQHINFWNQSTSQLRTGYVLRWVTLCRPQVTAQEHILISDGER